MKKTLRIVVAIAALLTVLGHNASAQSNYYWAVGSGDWNTPGNWRIGSVNGSAAPAPPSKNDNVFFSNDAFSSGAIITVSAPSAAKDFNYSVSNRAITLRVDNVLEIAGAITITNGNNNNKLTITTTAVAPATTNGSVAIKFTSPAGTTIRSGGSNTTIYGAPVIFDGTGGTWTLQDDMTVSGQVTFTRGIVIAKPIAPNNDDRPGPNSALANISSPMFVFNSSPVISGGSDVSHVDGYLRLVNARSATSGVKLPVGDGTYMRTVEFDNISNANHAFVIRYFRNMAPVFINPAMPTDIASGSDLKSVSDKEYWYVSFEGGSASYRFKVNYIHPAMPNYYRPDVPQGLTMANLNTASRWENMGRTLNTANSTIEIGSQARDYKWFTIGRTDNIGLPVRLVSFSAQQLDGRVQLKWQSASEENTSHFDVERSADGQHFAPLLTKKAQGSSSSLVSYNATDNNPLGGTSYYRLKMVDLDGTFEYSKLVSVNGKGTVLVRAYPNPSNGREVQFLALNGDKLVLQSVTDAFGKPVAYEASPVYGQGLYVNFYGTLPAGFYVATLVTNDDKRERVRIKFVVQ